MIMDYPRFEIGNVEFDTTWRNDYDETNEVEIDEFMEDVKSDLASGYYAYRVPDTGWMLYSFEDDDIEVFPTRDSLHTGIYLIIELMYVREFGEDKFENIENLSFTLDCYQAGFDEDDIKTIEVVG